MFIYVIVNSETLKIYVGQHKGRNLQKYLRQKQSHARYGESKRSHLYAAMRKHPKETWSIHPLISGIEDRQELNELERLLIKALNVRHQDVGYNLGPGGESAPVGNMGGRSNKGRVVSDETRQRQSESAKLRFADPQERLAQQQRLVGVGKPYRTTEHRQHLSEAHLGHKPSPEQLLHQSLAQKGKPKPPRTAEHIHNNAAALRGIKRSPESIAKNRAGHLGRPWSAARRAAYEATRLFIS